MIDWISKLSPGEVLDKFWQFSVLFAIVFLLVLLFRLQKLHDSFDLRDLIMENGKVSLPKFAQFGAFLVSTWGFVHLVVSDHLTEWYYGSYMVAWCGANLANKWLNRTTPDPAPATQTVTVNAPADQPVTVSAGPSQVPPSS